MDLLSKVQNAKIAFGVPTIDGKVDIHFLMSMQQTGHILNKYGIRYNIIPVMRDVYIARARNAIVTDMLSGDYTHLFFIDADMGWDADKVIKMIARDKDVVFGAYVMKNDEKKQYVHEPEKKANGDF